MSGTAEIIFMDDFEDLWDFLTYDIPKQKVDFAIHVKELCNIMGLDDDRNFLCGRLIQLLTDAALQYAETHNKSSVAHMTMRTFVTEMEHRRNFMKMCMEVFHSRALVDPRCILRERSTRSDLLCSD